MELDGRTVDEGSPPTHRLRSVAFSAFIVLLLLWGLGLVPGFMFTADVNLTPASWATWVQARVALHVGLAVLTAVAFTVANAQNGRGGAVAIGLAFVLVGTLLATNALRAWSSGPERVEGTVVSFHYGVFHSIMGNNGWDRDYATLRLRKADGTSYVLDLSSGPHAAQLEDLMHGCSKAGDQLGLTLLEALDAPLKVECLEHAGGAGGR